MLCKSILHWGKNISIFIFKYSPTFQFMKLNHALVYPSTLDITEPDLIFIQLLQFIAPPMVTFNNPLTLLLLTTDLK